MFCLGSRTRVLLPILQTSVCHLATVARPLAIHITVSVYRDLSIPFDPFCTFGTARLPGTFGMSSWHKLGGS